MIDGRPRFDTEAGHTPDHPRLRRINCPSEISATFYEVMSNAPPVDMVADPIGPDIKFHHCEVHTTPRAPRVSRRSWSTWCGN